MKAFATDQLLDVMDLSHFVIEQRARYRAEGVEGLVTPRERIYLPADSKVSERLRLSAVTDQ